MHKLFISIGTLTSGGAERVVSILTHPFAENFDQVEILLWHHAPVHYELDSRVKVTYLPVLSGSENRLKNCRYFRNSVKKQQPDLLLSFLTPFNMLTIVSLWGCRIKTVVCERNDPHFLKGGRMMEWIRNFLYRFADGALVQTNYGLACYPSYIRKKMKVIYNPIIMPSVLLGRALQTPKENLFVSVGRLEPQKNQEMLIRAFARFCNNHPEYRLTIYGEGSLRNELERLISNLGLQEKVMLPGSCKDVWQKLLNAKAFLLPSNAEGMSNALIEAMCLGLPVVSTKVSGSTDLIADGVNGYLIELNDEDAMVHSLDMIANNEERMKLVGQNAVKLYDKLNCTSIANEWMSYIITQL